MTEQKKDLIVFIIVVILSSIIVGIMFKYDPDFSGFIFFPTIPNF